MMGSPTLSDPMWEQQTVMRSEVLSDPVWEQYTVMRSETLSDPMREQPVDGDGVGNAVESDEGAASRR